MSLRPAWAEAFDPARLAAVRGLTPVTADWAFADADGAGVSVAVVDSGIEAGHPRVGAVAGFAAFTVGADGTVAVDLAPHDDPVGHGTACAGIIRTVAPACDLLSVRVLGDRLTGRGAAFAAGLQWAVASGARVVSCSLSSNRREHAAVFHELTDLAVHEGVVVVCAVSNAAGTSIPATFGSVISVAAHAGRDPFRWVANPRPPADFGAPGIDVEVPWRGGSSIVTTGNSFAAPHLAGHAARLLSRHPDLTPYEVKSVLRACASNAVRE